MIHVKGSHTISILIDSTNVSVHVRSAEGVVGIVMECVDRRDILFSVLIESMSHRAGLGGCILLETHLPPNPISNLKLIPLGTRMHSSWP